MNNPFSKYVIKDKKKDIVHTSVYGKIQSGDAIGSVSTESFEKRMKMEENRQIVKGYNDSKLVGSTFSNGPRAEKYTPLEKKEGIGMGARLTDDRVREGSSSISSTAQLEKSFIPPVKPDFEK